MKKILILLVFLLSTSLVWAGPPTKAEMRAKDKEMQQPHETTLADCDELVGYPEDYGYCIWDIAVEHKSIYPCAMLGDRSSAQQCLTSVFKLTEVTEADCNKMTDYVDVCVDLVKNPDQWKK